MRVLFVEDDAINRRVVRDMLSLAGVNLEEAPDAETGLQMIDSQDYAVVLLDLRMPGMNGMEAVKRIRARADEKASLPLIIVTADTSMNLRSECMRDGADEVLMKPVAMRSLFKTMASIMAGRAKGADQPSC